MNQPLTGKRVVVTRSSEQAEAMCVQLEALGATAVRFPVVDFAPLPAPELEAALAQLEQYDWLIFTSGNAVRFFFQRWREIRDWRLEIPSISNLPKIAAVGSTTRKLLAEKGIPVSFMPEEFTGEQLAQGLGNVAGKRILMPRAKVGRPEIVALLRERGALVEEIALYETVTAVPSPAALAELEKGVDVLTFTSSSSVRNFLQIAQPVGAVKIAVIGPSTAAEAKNCGLQVDIMPDEYMIEGLIRAVAQFYSEQISYE